ncbi:ferrichrome ABC transporter permease [Acetobacter aceti NRIC 0242]|uniref:Iron ABC transporter permease n=1 Tax=Acetobacter aceti NBRC 14818 TaxID=887700 RepID=A0AB33IHB8_ACEAC|nr:iron ABC transporter permease [Acetobacter aceti]TCS29418.1 iron complex transport system permease protein [Acetobacter aceti NBRC 14818]BCK76547.1 iron ABC transporter permease [Acetobacter aceti NBRC 14818]GAN57272.1 ABC transporter ferrichrome Fe3+-siderophore transporter [Acetobacter aceti NBRC 14818]GBO82304.1 ferrichrome ABC transporter permease [Acetobacter aceti NRIC 0242]
MKGAATLATTFVLLLVVATASLCIGRYPIPFHELSDFFLSSFNTADATCHSVACSILAHIRLPRLGAALLTGAALSVSGASYQAVFRNPLVSPGILGALSGAGFGAALGIILNVPQWMIGASAFAGSTLAVVLGTGIARLSGDSSVLMLIFGGLVSNALFTALLSILKYLADPDSQLPDIVFWLLGTLSRVTPETLSLVTIPMICAMAVLCIMGRYLDALSMGDDEARSLGVPVRLVRNLVVTLATLLCALTVSMTGIIGWVGLVIPHIARLLVGPGNRLVLPMSALTGAIFLTFSDDLARNLSAAEIPVGIMTELSGVILFLLLLPRVKTSLRGNWR